MTNGVGDKIIVAADFDPAVLSDYTDGIPVVICDIEGAEFEYLNPTRFPVLSAFDMIVEAHPDDSRTIEEFAGRFLATHRVDIVYPRSRNPAAQHVRRRKSSARLQGARHRSCPGSMASACPLISRPSKWARVWHDYV